MAFNRGNLWLAVLAAIGVGCMMGLLMAVVSVTMQAEQGISGIGLYLFGLGLSSLLFKTLIGSVESVSGFSRPCPCSAIFPSSAISFSITTYSSMAYLTVPATAFVLNRTTFGLSIRAVGHNPEAADSLGVNVNQIRYATLIIGAGLAGLAGASLSIGLLNVFQENMTNGLGFIAVALVYFGSWRPLGVLGGALLFSLVNALQLWVQVLGIPIPSDIVVMLPYILTVVVLTFTVRQIEQPAALAKPYERGE